MDTKFKGMQLPRLSREEMIQKRREKAQGKTLITWECGGYY